MRLQFRRNPNYVYSRETEHVLVVSYRNHWKSDNDTIRTTAQSTRTLNANVRFDHAPSIGVLHINTHRHTKHSKTSLSWRSRAIEGVCNNGRIVQLGNIHVEDYYASCCRTMCGCVFCVSWWHSICSTRRISQHYRIPYAYAYANICAFDADMRKRLQTHTR